MFSYIFNFFKRKYRLYKNSIRKEPQKESQKEPQLPKEELLDRKGNSVLHLNVNNYNKLQYFLNSKAIKYINHFNNRGETPLHIVNNINCYDLLISKGADLNLKNINNYIVNGPAYFYQNNISIFTKMLKDTNISRRGGNGATVFHNISNPYLIPLAIERGININSKDLSDNSALHTVKNIDCAKIFTKYLSVNDKNKNGNAPAHLCFDKEIIRHFLLSGYEVNTVNNEGKTALFTNIDNEDILKLYLKFNIDVGITDKYGKNAFDYCTNVYILSLYENAFKIPYLVTIDDINDISTSIVEFEENCIICKEKTNKIFKTSCSDNIHCSFNIYCECCISKCEKCEVCGEKIDINNIKRIRSNIKRKITGNLITFD